MEGLAGSPTEELQQAEGLGLHRGSTVHMATARGLPHMAFQCWAQRWGELLPAAHTCMCTTSGAEMPTQGHLQPESTHRPPRMAGNLVVHMQELAVG